MGHIDPVRVQLMTVSTLVVMNPSCINPSDAPTFTPLLGNKCVYSHSSAPFIHS